MGGLVSRAVIHLRREQDRVAAVVRRLGQHGWDAVLRDDDRDQLLTVGHFDEYSGELDWRPREVVGHLRDSAVVFQDRIARLRCEARPFLADFDTTAPARVMSYQETELDELVAGLHVAQGSLAAAVAALFDDDLALGGTHEVDGDLTIGDILEFLPRHQQDHAEQMERLLKTSSAAATR